jgi:hypothetical protein
MYEHRDAIRRGAVVSPSSVMADNDVYFMFVDSKTRVKIFPGKTWELTNKNRTALAYYD